MIINDLYNNKNSSLSEGMKAQDLAMYCEKLVAEKGLDAAYKHALMMANVGRDPAWNSVLKYLNAMKDGMSEGRMVKGPGGVPLDRQGRPVPPKVKPIGMQKWLVTHSGSHGEGGKDIIEAPNFETAWEIANEYDLDIIDVKPYRGPARPTLVDEGVAEGESGMFSKVMGHETTPEAARQIQQQGFKKSHTGIFFNVGNQNYSGGGYGGTVVMAKVSGPIDDILNLEDDNDLPDNLDDFADGEEIANYAREEGYWAWTDGVQFAVLDPRHIQVVKQGVAEGSIATVGWPDEGNHTGNNPPVSVGGTVPARPSVKQGSLVKASGLTGVYRVMDIRGDQAKIREEIPNTGQSTYIPMSDLRVWTNKPVKEQGMAEGAEEDMPVHRIGLTVIDPQHPMVSKRREQYQKTVRVPGHDREQAITSAINHLRRRGFKVLDHHYIGLLEDQLDELNKKTVASWIKQQPERIKGDTGLSRTDFKKAKRLVDKSIPSAIAKYKDPGYGKQEPQLAEVSLGDYRKKAALSKATSQMDKFFGRDDPEAVARADQTIAKREKGLGRADARAKAYTPPTAAPADLEKQQRDLTAKYPNIDELVRRAELNRDPNYEMADGPAYYAARDAEQNYLKLKQIQRVIQGLNESLNRSHLP